MSQFVEEVLPALLRLCLCGPLSYAGAWMMMNPTAAINMLNSAMLKLHELDSMGGEAPEPADDTRRLRMAMRSAGFLLTLFSFLRIFDIG